MDNFKYESEGHAYEREILEWDNVWWERPSDSTKQRVLYIGDSISYGIRRIATMLSEYKMIFDGFGTSKAVDNPFFADSVRLFAKQQSQRAIIIFNNGLHGWHLSDTEEYKNYYEKMVKFLMEEFAGTPLALVLTTSVTGENNERVIARNTSVKEIAEKYSLPVIDLYTPSVEYAQLRKDGVHYSDEGYEKLAQVILEALYKIVPEMEKR